MFTWQLTRVPLLVCVARTNISGCGSQLGGRFVSISLHLLTDRSRDRSRVPGFGFLQCFAWDFTTRWCRIFQSRGCVLAPETLCVHKRLLSYRVYETVQTHLRSRRVSVVLRFVVTDLKDVDWLSDLGDSSKIVIMGSHSGRPWGLLDLTRVTKYLSRRPADFGARVLGWRGWRRINQ